MTGGAGSTRTDHQSSSSWQTAERLTAWLGGVVVPNVYAAKQAAGRELG